MPSLVYPHPQITYPVVDIRDFLREIQEYLMSCRQFGDDISHIYIGSEIYKKFIELISRDYIDFYRQFDREQQLEIINHGPSLEYEEIKYFHVNVKHHFHVIHKYLRS